MEKQDIKNFTIEELEERLAEIPAPPFRARQISEWLYRKGVLEFSRMKNLSKDLQKRLDTVFYVSRPEIAEIARSADGTEKFLFQLTGRGHSPSPTQTQYVETVLIPERERRTVCLSTQVGCRYKCAFCASGKNGFTRNLTLAEIINQLLFIRFKHNQKITNVVFMGMGEPFDNYENLVRAISVINHSQGLGIGARKITVSTCGIIPGIARFQNLGRQVELSVSLHAAKEELRRNLMPVSKKYPLKELVPALADYTRKTGRVITLEYLLVKDVNDSVDCAEKLVDITKHLKAKVNLLGYSLVAGNNYRAPEKEDVLLFANRLTQKGIFVTIRKSRGNDIAAACGQLAGKRKNEI
ncbi:MAG: 23S rRNA (adenine(2503)-C(2))-methyltransferase RlmN [Candidatus Omnitrophota bacterium]|nr:23S rRNA (adenine(2503)-C(2))-methyltransferase RlmN [Candidatus Omnitrophota bacterium]